MSSFSKMATAAVLPFSLALGGAGCMAQPDGDDALATAERAGDVVQADSDSCGCGDSCGCSAGMPAPVAGYAPPGTPPIYSPPAYPAPAYPPPGGSPPRYGFAPPGYNYAFSPRWGGGDPSRGWSNWGQGNPSFGWTQGYPPSSWYQGYPQHGWTQVASPPGYYSATPPPAPVMPPVPGNGPGVSDPNHHNP